MGGSSGVSDQKERRSVEIFSTCCCCWDLSLVYTCAAHDFKNEEVWKHAQKLEEFIDFALKLNM